MKSQRLIELSGQLCASIDKGVDLYLLGVRLRKEVSNNKIQTRTLLDQVLEENEKLLKVGEENVKD